MRYMERIPLTRLGQTLKSMRKGRGLTQMAVAQLAHVPRLKVIQAERGDPRVSIAAYAEIARALGGDLSIVPVRRPTLEEARELFADAN